jgi:hypothetical protein
MLIAIQVVLAVVEFFLINWLGKHSISSGYHRISFVQTVEDSPLFDFTFRVLAPTIFLALTSALWYSLGLDALIENYWRVTLFYFAVRWGFNLAMGRALLLNWWKQAVIAALGIVLSYFVSERLLTDRVVVMPSARGLSDEFWIVVIGFLYLTANRVNWPQVGASADERKRAYLTSQYRRLSRRYGAVISKVAAGKAEEVLSYAIMIYETFNRPAIYQLLENWVLFPIGVASTLGPMQVGTALRLPNEELVRLGVEHVNAGLASAFEQMKRESPEQVSVSLRRDPEAGYETPYQVGLDLSQVRFEDVAGYYQLGLVQRAAAKYNIRSDYPGEVAGIFGFLRDKFYPNVNPDIKPASRDS